MEVRHIVFAGLIGTILSLLSACDYVVSYEKTIFNDTDTDLLLVRNNVIRDTAVVNPEILIDTVILAPGMRQILTKDIQRGGSAEAFSHCPHFPVFGDTLFGQAADNTDPSKILILTQSDLDNAFRDISKTHCECTFTITPEMFEN